MLRQEALRRVSRFVESMKAIWSAIEASAGKLIVRYVLVTGITLASKLLVHLSNKSAREATE